MIMIIITAATYDDDDEGGNEAIFKNYIASLFHDHKDLNLASPVAQMPVN